MAHPLHRRRASVQRRGLGKPLLPARVMRVPASGQQRLNLHLLAASHVPGTALAAVREQHLRTPPMPYWDFYRARSLGRNHASRYERFPLRVAAGRREDGSRKSRTRFN